MFGYVVELVCSKQPYGSFNMPVSALWIVWRVDGCADPEITNTEFGMSVWGTVNSNDMDEPGEEKLDCDFSMRNPHGRIVMDRDNTSDC